VVNELKLNLESIVSEYYAPLYRFALSLARHESEAADLTQQTFFILAQRSHQIRDVSKIKCWLFTTLRREFLRNARHQSNHPEVEFLPDHHDSPIVDAPAVRLADARIVLDALKNVDETYRTALELFYLGELSYREIAGILEIPIGTVMSRLSRGKDQLKALLSTAIAQNQSKIIQLPRDARSSK
jgi:RNA polymerase sigma-70 factor (ECF subfamily)